MLQTAQPVNQALTSVLAGFGAPAQAAPGSREFHQAMALLAAQQIRQCYSKSAKEEARQKCLAHLRASLVRPKEASHG